MSFDQFLTILLSPPEAALNIFNVISSLGMIVIMFGLGLKINFTEIKKNFIKPRDLLTGLFFQIILIPVIAIVFVVTTNFPPNIKIAILIIACMPSAATSNFITSKINGDTSLSITLTSICTFLTIYTIPFFLKIFSIITKEDFSIFNVDLTGIIIKVFTIITLPIIIGLLFKHYVPQVKIIEKNLDKISFVLFIIIIKFAIYLSAINIQDPVQNLIAVFIFMIIIVFLILVITKLMNVSIHRKKALVAEALLQNNILGFVVVFSITGSGANLIPTLAIYGVSQYLVFMLLFYTLLKNKSSIYNSDKI